VSDALNRSVLQTSRVLSGAVGDPLHVEAEMSELRGRISPSASVGPACHGDGCFTTRGFEGPNPGSLRDYWREDVVGAVLASGFSRAAEGEKAPRLVVSEARDGDLVFVILELRDDSGALLSSFRGRFRRGYPLETSDDDRDGARLGLLQYLLHGNFFGFWIPRAVLPAGTPVKTFLRTGSALAHPQTRAATPVALEIMSEKTYEPVWIIKTHDDGTTSWGGLVFDKPRSERCAPMLKPDRLSPGSTSGWMLFAADPTGRKKVRKTNDALCEENALWLFDYATERGKVTLTKYSAAGDFAYRISFDKPASAYGFAGGIMLPTFKARDGYLSFDWCNSKQAGNDRHIKQVIKVRLVEPKAPTS
jgi:hypothetical protein